MALTITGQIMRSPHTGHFATAWPVPGELTLWTVTYLPGRTLTQDQAEAAMRIADAVGEIPADCDPEVYDEAFWSRADAWAAELGMSGPAAVGRASESPEDAAGAGPGKG
jgi:hypothetical protein